MDRRAELADLARDIIDSNVYLTLGTADGDGRPWATPVYFAHQDYRDFYWISSPDTTHSRNLAVRSELGIVVFDSGVPVGTGQAVYMSAVGTEMTEGADLDRSLTVYPGAGRGGWSITLEDVLAPAPLRMYRATASQHWMLCKLPRPCAEHGGAGSDHRVAVDL
ncbi:MAG: pyridoxamine 5'-phosphate oxidase family protein [Sporichthyaceae bacterium]|nr:pyridoxamine 5'-phosphate oxidase family protein [Sporichthyaceae bacterium]